MADDATVDVGMSLEPMNKALDAALGLFKGFGTKVRNVLGTALAVTGIGALFTGLGAGLSNAFGELADKEREVTKLNVALKASGGVAGYTSDQLKEMADNMERLTGIEAETVMGAQAVALQFKNIRGDTFKELLDISADFAAQTGTDLPSAAEKWGRALNDPLKGFRQLSKEGIIFSKEQEKMAEEMIRVGDVAGVQRIMLEGLSNTFGGGATDAANTFGGKMRLIEIAIGDVFEAIAAMLQPALTAVLPYIQQAADYAKYAAESMSGWTDIILEWSNFLIDVGINTVHNFVTACVTGFTVAQTVIENWQEIAEIALVTFQYRIVTTFNQLTHFFTEVLPTLLDWFGENWEAVFTDAYLFLGNVIYRMSTNLQAFFEAVASWLSGDGFDFKWTGLTEGFESTMKELPKIAERVPGELEKALGSEMEVLGKSFNKKLGDNISNNLNFVDSLFGKIDKDLASKGKNSPKGTPSDADYVVDKDPKEEKDQSEAGKIEDLASLQKRIQSASFKTPEAKELEGQTTLMKAQNDNFVKFKDDFKKQAEKQTEELKKVNKTLENEPLPGYAP